MNRTGLLSALLLASLAVFFSISPVFGDEATLADVHETLLKAAGYQADTPPTVAEQTELLHQAIKMLHDIPHVYHGQLKAASRYINAALTELESGDTAHHAREDIFNADDEIKKIM